MSLLKLRLVFEGNRESRGWKKRCKNWKIPGVSYQMRLEIQEVQLQKDRYPKHEENNLFFSGKAHFKAKQYSLL